jgi:hypothetical protein
LGVHLVRTVVEQDGGPAGAAAAGVAAAAGAAASAAGAAAAGAAAAGAAAAGADAAGVGVASSAKDGAGLEKPISAATANAGAKPLRNRVRFIV